MTFMVDQSHATSTPSIMEQKASTQMDGVTAVPPSMPIVQRKRKDLDEQDHETSETDGRDAPLERQLGIKNIRRVANMPRTNAVVDGADEEAQFHPLPADLNMHLLANLGYLNNALAQQHQGPGSVRTSHSPTSSFSDFGGPATPSDVVGSAESYFAKGMRRDSSNTAAYPDFKIYPEEQRMHTPGLMGMTMHTGALSGPAEHDGMQVDGGEEIREHGPQCKSIPQLHVRSEPGIYSELWAKCPDCGSMSKVEAPPVSDALSYSP